MNAVLRALITKNHVRRERNPRGWDALGSPLKLVGERVRSDLIDRHVRGRVLDVGCGTMRLRDAVMAHAAEYHGLDVEPRAHGVRYIADAQSMAIVPSACYDTVLCFSVLEHLREPSRALHEIHRVLAVGGRFVGTTPFLARLHELPNDYYRFTANGLRHMLESAGFDVLEIRATAGAFAFVGHQVATLVLSVSDTVPGGRIAATALSYVLNTMPALLLDRLTRNAATLPAAYAFAAVKRAPPSASEVDARDAEQGT